MINELQKNRLDLYNMKSEFEDQVKRVKELIIRLSDNKEVTEELANLLFRLGGDVERIKSDIVTNKKLRDLLAKEISLG